MSMTPITRSLFAAGILAVVTVVYSATELPRTHSIANAASAAPFAAAVNAGNAAALPDFSSLVASYGPAVVNITVTEATKTSLELPDTPGGSPDDPFSQFFRRFPVPLPQADSPVRGVGSGFIVSPDGTILTNAHVVDGAKSVTVKLTDRREFTAKVIGKDSQSDVAVLKIDAKGLPTVKLGDSSKVRVGQWVAAIGSPFGFENTVTSGIVSAKARRLPNENYVPFLQTDVPVNPGNSGGPLFNMNGEVVGINAQIYSRTGGFQGLSFAVPINLAMQVEDQLQHHGHVTRGRLGASIQDVNQALADSFGLKTPTGALVSSVDPHGPAAAAGLEPGDVILRLNGQEITQSSDLPTLVAAMRPGASAQLDIWRGGNRRSLTVVVSELKDSAVAADTTVTADHGKLGLVLHPSDPGDAQARGANQGLIVDAASGPAAAAGIQPGDVILAINGTPVKSVEQMRGLVARAGKHVALLVQHDDATIFVPIDLG